MVNEASRKPFSLLSVCSTIENLQKSRQYLNKTFHQDLNYCAHKLYIWPL